MRLKLLGLLCLFSLLLSSQGGASAQHRRRPKKRKQAQAVKAVDVPPVGIGAALSQLILVVSVTETRQVLLNQEDEGNLSDLSQLRARLQTIFDERRRVGAFRPGTTETEKTVIVKASSYLKSEEIDRIVAEIKAAGADPVKVMTEAEFKAQLEDRGDPTLTTSNPSVSEGDKERIRQGEPISGGVLNRKAISIPRPVYPAIARAAKASGMVTVEIIVDENGRVISAQAIAGHPLLRASAVQAALQARFSPTLLSGQPVKVKGVLTYNFSL